MSEVYAFDDFCANCYIYDIFYWQIWLLFVQQ